MDIQLLKVFFATAQEGSISKAAQRLNFVQSNVTHKIQQLEADLQTQLFYRHNRGITLTLPGKFCSRMQKKNIACNNEPEQPSETPPSPRGRSISDLWKRPLQFGCRSCLPITIQHTRMLNCLWPQALLSKAFKRCSIMS